MTVCRMKLAYCLTIAQLLSMIVGPLLTIEAANALEIRQPTVNVPNVRVPRSSGTTADDSLPIPNSGVRNPPRPVIRIKPPETVFDRCRSIPGTRGDEHRPLYCDRVPR